MLFHILIYITEVRGDIRVQGNKNQVAPSVLTISNKKQRLKIGVSIRSPAEKWSIMRRSPPLLRANFLDFKAYIYIGSSQNSHGAAVGAVLRVNLSSSCDFIGGHQFHGYVSNKVGSRYLLLLCTYINYHNAQKL